MQFFKAYWPIIASIALAIFSAGGYIANLQGQGNALSELRIEQAELRGKVETLEIKAATFNGQTITQKLEKIEQDVTAVKKDIEWLTRGSNRQF